MTKHTAGTELVPVLTLNLWFKPTQLCLKGQAALGREVDNSFAYQAERSVSLGELKLSINVLFN